MSNEPYIHREENVKLSFGAKKEFTILDTSPTNFWKGCHLVTRQVSFQAPIQVFVEEYSQSDRLENSRLRHLKELDYLIAADTGKPLEKIINRISGF